MAKHVKIESSLDLVFEIADTSFGTGSWFYEVTTSQYLPNSIMPGAYQYSGSTFIEYTGSLDMSGINDMGFVKALNDHDLIDYKKYRSWLKDYVIANNFYSLSLDDRKICAKNFVVDKTEINTVYTQRDQIIFGNIYHKRSMKARIHRVNRSISELYNRLKKTDAKQVISDIVHGLSGSDDNLVWQYESFGIEGTLEGDVNGLFDYVLARTGSAFSGSGLRDKNYTMIVAEDSMDSLSNDIFEILKNGNYDWWR